jgi:hypothetical protein
MTTQSVELDAAILTFAMLIEAQAERQMELEKAADVVGKAAQHVACRGLSPDGHTHAEKVVAACALVPGAETMKAAARALRTALQERLIDAELN